jgi:hypothetical protein
MIIDRDPASVCTAASFGCGLALILVEPQPARLGLRLRRCARVKTL